MPTSPDAERRIALLRAELLDIGLDWTTHYRLVEEGSRWVLNYTSAITPDQYNRAEELLALIMNR